MNAENIKATLATITTESMTNGTMTSLWEELPMMVSGETWVAEIVDCAERMSEYLSGDVNEDELMEFSHQFADSEVEDYYKIINARVQGLDLWAYSELDEEVENLNSGTGFLSITDLNTQYLYCAMRGLFETIARWAYENTEEGNSNE
jgi:hypothetical protein